MPEQKKPEENIVHNTAEVVRGILDAEISREAYSDLVRPGASEMGHALATVGGLVNLLLVPIEIAGYWSREKVEAFKRRIDEKAIRIPESRRIVPPLHVAGPAIASARFTADCGEVREMFASLLVTAMDSDTVESAHPSFAGVISEMSPDEARIVRLFRQTKDVPVINVRWSHGMPQRADLLPTTATTASAFTLGHSPGYRPFTTVVRHFSTVGEAAGCQYSERVALYLDNLSRLGICEVHEHLSLPTESAYEPLELHPLVQTAIDAYVAAEVAGNCIIHRCMASRTDYGEEFCRACITD